MHLKRQKVPKSWPIARKGTTYVIKPNFSLQKGIPILIVLRDILKIAQNRKEVKKALHLKQILVNSKIAINEKNSVLLFDTITIIPSKKNYKLALTEKGKFKVEEIKEKESLSKIVKIVNKKTLKGKKTQLNLSDGKNILSDLKCNVHDSVILDLKDKKIIKILPLKEKANAIIFAGKHSGIKGVINKIKLEDKIAELNINEKNVNVLIKQLMVIE